MHALCVIFRIPVLHAILLQKQIALGLRGQGVCFGRLIRYESQESGLNVMMCVDCMYGVPLVRVVTIKRRETTVCVEVCVGVVSERHVLLWGS